MGQVLADARAKAGIKGKVVIAEQAKWQEAWYSVGPGQKRIAMGASGHDNFGDSRQTFDAYLTCGGRASSYCNPFLEERGAQTRPLVGEDRVRAFKDIWKQA